MSEDTGVLRSSSLMAAGTIASRITGLVKNSVLLAAIGNGVFADTYTVANILPTVVYVLLIGGAINAVFVPQLVRHMRVRCGQRRGVRATLVHRGGDRADRDHGRCSGAAPWLVQLYGKDWSQPRRGSRHCVRTVSAAADFLLRTVRCCLAGAEHPRALRARRCLHPSSTTSSSSSPRHCFSTSRNRHNDAHRYRR